MISTQALTPLNDMGRKPAADDVLSKAPRDTYVAASVMDVSTRTDSAVK